MLFEVQDLAACETLAVNAGAAYYEFEASAGPRCHVVPNNCTAPQTGMVTKTALARRIEQRTKLELLSKLGAL